MKCRLRESEREPGIKIQEHHYEHQSWRIRTSRRGPGENLKRIELKDNTNDESSDVIDTTTHPDDSQECVGAGTQRSAVSPRKANETGAKLSYLLCRRGGKIHYLYTIAVKGMQP